MTHIVDPDGIVMALSIESVAGVEALSAACRLAGSIAEDAPWSDDARQLVEELRIVADNLLVKPKE